MWQALSAPLFNIASTPVTTASILMFLAILGTTLLVSRLAQRATRRALEHRGPTDDATVTITARLLHYAIIVLGLGIGVQTIGVDLGALFAAGAFFAVALGFAMQNVAQNFVAGVILLAERTIKPNDVLEVEGRMVRVTRMGLRATVARSRDEEDLIIPNATLVQSTVTNYTLRDPTYRLRTSVGVSYHSDMDAVIRVLLDAARSLPERLEAHEPRVLMTEFADSAVVFEVVVWTQNPWEARVTRSSLNEAIWRGLKAANITIPFPQRDVHVIRHRNDA
ncbi:MAG: mechanosensitive ion channel [Gemmatimonadaceae bacterium]|nr:mechanosensitive ion channel [Gemmatimonadaceae bacterium]